MKKTNLLFCFSLSALLVLSACSGENTSSSGVSSQQQPQIPSTTEEIAAHNGKIDPDTIHLIQLEEVSDTSMTATVKTDLGDIEIVLFPEEAPDTVQNFVELSKDGFYDGLEFYQVFPGVRIASGATDNIGDVGKSASGQPFAEEPSLNLWHFNGALAMVREQDKSDSRFYIVENASLSDEVITQLFEAGFPQPVIDAYLKTGGVPAYDQKDTVFGQVYGGQNVVAKIAGADRDIRNKPKTPVHIVSIEIH